MSDDERPAIERVREWIQKQGYALEHETLRAMAAVGFHPQLGWAYQDPTTGKVRDIDVVAELGGAARSQVTNVEVLAVVECKVARQYPWVVRTTAAIGSDEWRPIGSAAVGDFLEREGLARGMVPVSDQVAYAVVEARERGDGDAAFATLAQVVSAAQGVVVKVAGPVFCHPIVVLDGDLVALSYDRLGDAQLERARWARVFWSGSPTHAGSVVVDIVTRAHLEERASSLHTELTRIRRAIAGFRPPPGAIGF